MKIDNLFIDQCLDRFEHNIQIDILQEECAELIQACSKLKRLNGHSSYSDLVSQMKEEMAHVLISLNIVARIYGITSNDVIKEVFKKAEKYNFKC